MTKPAICKLFIQNKESVKWKTSESQTKKNLKYTLVDMLAEQPFEKITITEALQPHTEISRITFYSHYSDKYALVDEMFQDMIVLGTKEYEKKAK